MFVLLALLACVRTDPRPDVGSCADTPDGRYTYGEIGIGTCLAGPQTLRFTGGADPALVVVNADPYRTFTGGSALAIPWSSVDLDAGRNLLGDLDASAVSLPPFPSGLALTEDQLGLVGVRFSEDSQTRTSFDDLYLIDFADPASPALSSRGTDGGPLVEVGADPVDVVVDSSTGLAFVADRTNHAISVVDTLADPVEVVPPWPSWVLRDATFVDTGETSTAELADLQPVDSADLTSDNWSLTWVEGTWRLWMPAEGGLVRDTFTGGDYARSGYGLELDVSGSEDLEVPVGEVLDPCFLEGVAQGRMIFLDGQNIRAAVTDEYLADWLFEEDALLEPDPEGWDAALGGPDLLLDDGVYYLFYDGNDGADWGIGLARGEDGVVFGREDAPVLSPTWDHEAARVADPDVIWDAQIGRWRMYYGAFDGTTWTIGHALSDDLVNWTADPTPIFQATDADAGAPVVSVNPGRFRMWYARRGDDGLWGLGAAESRDGTHWTDLGQVDSLDDTWATAEDPPGPALADSLSNGFRIEGEEAGSFRVLASPGSDYGADTYGWTLRPLAGARLSNRAAGVDSWGGVTLDSVDTDAGLGWLTLRDRAGGNAIGLATLGDDDAITAEHGAVLEPTGDGGDFDGDGVYSPVVFPFEGQYVMLYAGEQGDVSTIGVATSPDGRTWTRQGQALGLGEDWDSAGLLPGSVVAQDDGTLVLWYTGSNGDDLHLGTAVSEDGLHWTRAPGERRDWLFAPGSPGDWDDSGVRDPYVLRDEDGDHLWYAGFDGETWRLGYAFRAAGSEDWERSADTVTGESRSILGDLIGYFHPDGAVRPVVIPEDQGYTVWFSGLDEGVTRVGLARGEAPDRLHELPLLPSVGDQLLFQSRKGDADTIYIPLDTVLDNTIVSGEGLVGLYLDEARGFLFAAVTHTNYLFVIDVRDDSTGSFEDANYLDVEAVLTISSASGGAGFRDMVASPDADLLYAINDSPDAVFVLDISGLEDDATPNLLHDTLVGYLPAPRPLDQGVDNVSRVGPGQLALSPDGDRLFVSFYNSNSVGVYDLNLGPYGTMVREIMDVGEGPYALALSPDGKQLVVGNYLGEVVADGLVSSTLAVIDVDESSPSQYEVLTWLVNR